MKTVSDRANAAAYAAIVVVCLTLAVASDARAHKKPDKDLLSATASPGYAPGAAAEVIYDRGILEFELGIQPHSNLSVERRIKIYSEAGYEHGEVKIPYGSGEQVSRIKAVTWLPTGEKVEALDVHEVTQFESESKGGTYRQKAKVIAFPRLCPGAVLDLSYELREKYFVFVRPWIFQSDIPTRESSFEARLPHGLIYTSYQSNPTGIVIQDNSADWSGMSEVEATWFSRYVAAVEHEQLAAGRTARAARLYLTLKGFDFGEGFHEIWTGWNSLDAAMNEICKDAMNSKGGLESFAGATDDAMPVAEQVVRTRQRILEWLTSTGERAVGPSRSVAQILQSGVADQAERTTVLIAALQRMGIAAQPVWVCGRDLVTPVNAALAMQFTDMIAFVPALGDLGYVHCFEDWPIGELPPFLEGTLAFVANGQGGEAILTPESKATSNTMSIEGDLHLTEAGDLSGDVAITTAGQFAASARSAARSADGSALRDWLAETLSESMASAMSDAEIRDGDEPGGIIVTASLSRTGFAKLAGDVLVLEAPFLAEVDAVLDPAAQRFAPIERAFAFHQSERIAVELPTGWRLARVPEPSESSTESARYKVGIADEGTSVVAARLYEVISRIVPPARYREVALLAQNARQAARFELLLERGATEAKRD